MINPIPDRLKDIWDEWNIRAMILVSLSMQIILILFAPFRKSIPKKPVIWLIWSSYLLADWAASFALDTSLAVAKTLIILVIGKILLLVLDTTSPTVKSQNL